MSTNSQARSSTCKEGDINFYSWSATVEWTHNTPMLPSARHFRLAYIVVRDLGNIYYTHAHLAKDRYNYSIYIAHHAKPLDAHSHTLYDACIIMFRAACCCKDQGPHNHIRMHGSRSPHSPMTLGTHLWILGTCLLQHVWIWVENLNSSISWIMHVQD